jgi:hypothetical protein
MNRGGAKNRLRTRVHLGDASRSYPAYAPKVIVHRVRHYLVGPLLGCSCSGPGSDAQGRRLGRPSLLAAEDGSCFYSRWRVEYPARDRYQDRTRIADLERRMRLVDGEHPRRAA